MADAVWPVALPQAPITAKVTGSDEPAVVRTAMDAGPPKVRRRYSAPWESWTVLLRVTRLQLETLNTFFRTTTEAGALPFEWKHFETGNQVDMRFRGPPQKRANAPRNAGKLDLWDVEFEVELVPGTEVTGEEPPPEAPPDPIIEFAMMPFDPPVAEPVDADLGPGEYVTFIVREAVAPEPDVVVWITQLPFDPPLQDDGGVGGSGEFDPVYAGVGGGSGGYKGGFGTEPGGGDASS